MKKLLMFISAASLLLVSCTKEQFVEEMSYSGPVTVVSATFESLSNGATKAAVNDEGVFTWQNGDKAAFTVSTGTSYYVGTNSSDGKTAQFAIEESLTFTSESFAYYPSDLTTVESTSSLKVKVPATRVWATSQTNVAMYGAKVNSDPKFNFTHMGGLVRVRVNNVPTNAREFVFKASGYKINGEFTVETESEYKVIKTASSNTEGDQTYTLSWSTAPAAENTMDFYIPLPVGTYSNGFAFYLKDENHNTLYSKEGTTSQSVARKQLLLMPSITLMGGEIEPAKKPTVVANIPAGYSGDFPLPQSEKVLLKINTGSDAENKDINLKYIGGNLPAELEIQVVGEHDFNKTLSGDLPYTHVDFTQGTVNSVEMTTSASTFEIVYPAKINATLTVKGGNVKVRGAEVGTIVVTEKAVADGETKAPVQVVVEEYGGYSPGVVNVTAHADVVASPGQEQSIKVTADDGVKVAKGGEGEVTDKDDQPIDTKAAAQIGDIKYITLADAIAAVKDEQEIKLIADVDKAAGITVPSGKNFTVNFDGHTYAMECPGAGSEGTKTIGFQLLKGSTIVFKGGEGEKVGTIKCTSENKTATWSSGSAQKGIAMMIQNYANLTLDNMKIDASNIALNDKTFRYAISNNSGDVKFTGNTTITTNDSDYAFDVCKYGDYAAPTVTWNSTGSVTGGIELSGGEFVLGHNLAVKQPIKVIAPATLNLGDCTLSAANEFTRKTAGVIIVNRKGDLTVKGNANGTIQANQVYAAVLMTEKDVDTKDTTNPAKLTVESGTLIGLHYGIVGNGSTGRGNTVITIKGGIVKGTKENDCAGIYHPQSGTLTVNNGIVEGAVGIYVKAGTVTTAVDGGTIKGIGAKSNYSPCTNGFHPTGDAIVFDNCGYPGGEPNATINGGTFISNNGNAVASYATGSYSPISPVIYGGTFSDMSGVKYVADNGTYKLASNVTLATPLEITSGKTFTIDLGGKTLTGRTNISGANVTFKNGTVAGGANQAINIYGSETEASNYSVVTISDGVEVKADVYAVCVFGKYNGIGVGAGTTGYGAVANIAGKITTTGDEKNGAVFVSGNLGKGETSSDWAVSSKNAVNIQSTAMITSNQDAAVALNGSATVTVESGAQLIGATAIAAKRGKLVVNGGTITGTMDPGMSNPTTFMNGTEMTGSAVSATASYKADGPLSVVINGGTFDSKAYTILNNHDGCTFEIYGGMFGTQKPTDGIAVYARLGSVNITGGEFTNNSNSEATLHVGCPSVESLQPKLTISGESTVVKNNASGDYTYGGKPLVVNMANQLTYKAVEISGGKFYYRDPSKDDNVAEPNGAFLANGCKVTGDETNGWTVSAQQN